MLQWFRNDQPIPSATNELFEISSMMPGDAGTYQVAATNELGTSVSDPVERRVVPLRIIDWTRSLWAMDGDDDDTYLWVLVDSVLPVEYQWRKQGENLSGQTNHGIDFLRVTLQDSGEYDVVVSNAAGSRTSVVMTVTIEPRPLFFVFDDPQTHTVAVGLPFELSNQASGSLPIHYQWYRNDEAVPGASSNVFRIGSAGFNDAGDYYLTAANPAGSITSQIHQVAIELLVIHPLNDLSVPWLNPLTYLSYVESSVPWKAQWYFNGAAIPDGTNAALSFPAFDDTNAGQYVLVASNIYGVVTSSVATLTVVTQEPWVWATTEHSKVWVGESVELHGFTSGGPPPTLQWLFNGEPLGPAIPNAPSVSTYLTLQNVTTNQSGTYALMASNMFGMITSGPLSLVVAAEAPFFVSVPVPGDDLAGDIVTLRARAVAGPPPVYQWRKDGADLPGETNSTLTLDNAQPNDGGVYCGAQ